MIDILLNQYKLSLFNQNCFRFLILNTDCSKTIKYNNKYIEINQAFCDDKKVLNIFCFYPNNHIVLVSNSSKIL